MHSYFLEDFVDSRDRGYPTVFGSILPKHTSIPIHVIPFLHDIVVHHTVITNFSPHFFTKSLHYAIALRNITDQPIIVCCVPQLWLVLLRAWEIVCDENTRLLYQPSFGHGALGSSSLPNKAFEIFYEPFQEKHPSSMCNACNLNLVHQMYEQVDLNGKNTHGKNFFKQAHCLNGIFSSYKNY